jgi:hypothetical protein
MRFSRSATQAAGGGKGGGVFVVPTRYQFSLLAIGMTCVVLLQAGSKSSLFRNNNNNKEDNIEKEHRAVLSQHHHQQDGNNDAVTVPQLTTPSSSYQESKPVLRGKSSSEGAEQQCRFYMAESAVAPNSGMGMFTATGLLKDEDVGFPDICIFVSDSPKHWTHLRSHSWGWGQFFGQYEGSDSRAACEGYATIYNTMPDAYINTKIHSLVQQTTAGVRRDITDTPAAGSMTQHYGIHSKTLDVVPAGTCKNKKTCTWLYI